MGLYGKSFADDGYNIPAPSSPTPIKRVNAGAVTLGFLNSLKNKAKSYLDQNKDGKVTVGEVGGAAKKLPGQTYNAVVKPTVDTLENLPGDLQHGLTGAGIAVKSMATGEKGAQLAASKRQAADEMNKTSFAKLNLFNKKDINDKGVYTGKKDLKGDALKIAGKTGEDVLNIASLGTGAGMVVKAGAETAAKQGLKLLVKEGAKTGAKYGAAYGATDTAQQDAPTLSKLLLNMGLGAAAGGVVGGAASGAISLATKGVGKIVSKVASTKLDDATRTNIMHELAMAGHHDAAVKMVDAKTGADVVKAIEGTKFHPATESKVKVPLDQQNLDPAKDVTPAGEKIDTQTGEIIPHPIGAGPVEKIAQLEDALKNHPKSPALAVDTARRIAREKGMDNEQYSQLLKVTLDKADEQHAFADSANQVSLAREAEAAAPQPEKVSSSDQASRVSLDQNAKNAQEQVVAKQRDAAIRGGGLNPIEMPGMEKYRARAEAYKKDKVAENAMLDEKYAPPAAEIAAADRNAVAPEPVSLLKPDDTKSAVSIVSEPKVTLEPANVNKTADSVTNAPANVNEPASVRTARSTEEVKAMRDSGVQAIDDTVAQIAAAARAKGKTPEEFFKMIDKGKVPSNMKDELAAHQELLKNIRAFSEQSYGDIGEHYVPHQNLDAPKLASSDLFDTTFDFAKHRTGALKDYSHDYEAVMHNLAVQASDAKARLFQMAKEQGVTVDKILDDQKVARDLAEAAKKDQLGKMGIGDRLYQNDVAEAKRTGEPIPERAVVTESLDKFTRYMRDGWTSLKQSGVWNEVFEPISRAGERANYNFETLVKPQLDNIEGTMAALAKVGIKEPERQALIQRDLMGLNHDAVEPFLRKLLYTYEKSEGKITLTNWLRSHEITDPTLKELVNKHAEYMLASEAVVPDLARKATNFITGRVYKAALGLNVRSTMNQLFEGKRTLAREGFTKGGKLLAQAVGSHDYRTKYGIHDTSVEQQLNLIKNKDPKAWAALKNLDDKQMYFFMKGEGYKNEVMLRAGEQAGIKKGLTGDDLFKHTMDYFEKYSHVYGHLGTVGVYDNNLVKVLGQFGQYAAKDLALTGDMVMRAAGKGNKVDLTTRREAIGYLARLTAINTGLYAVMSAAIGATWQEVFGGPSLNGGPLVGLVTDLYTGVQSELQASQDEGRGFDAGKAVNRAGKRAVAGTVIPSGNQLINKTGVQAFLPDDNPIKKTFTDGALMDMEQGYNESAKGRARFLAPKGGEEAAKALAFGPYSTQASQDYFKNGGKALGQKQTEELNAADNQEQTYNDIIAKRTADAAAAKEKAAAKASGQTNYGKIKPALKQLSLKPKKAGTGRKGRVRTGLKIKTTGIKKARKPRKSKAIKLGIKT